MGDKQKKNNHSKLFVRLLQKISDLNNSVKLLKHDSPGDSMQIGIGKPLIPSQFVKDR
jgi:hypothetical protein